MKQLKKGQLLQKEGDVFKILDIVNTNIKGFKREEIVVGCLKTTEAFSVSKGEILNNQDWQSFREEQIQVQYIERKVIKDENKKIIVLSEKIVDSPKPRIQDKNIPNTALGNAFKEAINNKKEKVVNIGHITNIHEEKNKQEEKELDVLDYRNFASCTYNDLSILGNVFGENPDTIKTCAGKFQKGMATLHMQCLDRFRENNITIADLRHYCPNRQTGKPLTLSGTISRLNKAIWHYGTKKEQECYGW